MQCRSQIQTGQHQRWMQLSKDSAGLGQLKHDEYSFTVRTGWLVGAKKCGFQDVKGINLTVRQKLFQMLHLRIWTIS